MRINTGADATVILAGEPTGNMDARTADEITAVLKEGAHASGNVWWLRRTLQSWQSRRMWCWKSNVDI